jgi:DNA-directed RNA polymerase subunit beta'
MIYSDKYQYFRIGLASPEQILRWAERKLPNGELVGRVTKPYTIHYKTRKPKRDGLFCERIFGPTKSGTCACGKYQDLDIYPSFCEQCGVEFTNSQVRRRRMGYIKLGASVAHVWYTKGHPSYIAYLLKQSLEDIESLVYYRV